MRDDYDFDDDRLPPCVEEEGSHGLSPPTLASIFVGFSS